MKQRGLFDLAFRLDKLTEMGDPLIKIDEIINWEMFRPILNKVFKKKIKSLADAHRMII